jgi:hypothetical protein
MTVPKCAGETGEEQESHDNSLNQLVQNAGKKL